MKEEKLFRTIPIAIQLKEGNNVEEIPPQVQVMRTGTFFDKRYGKVEILREHFENMITKFSEGIRGIELMIDYKHDSDAEAAGWIKELDIIDVQLSEADLENGIEERTEAQLWATVDWTPKGTKKLADREFAYLSADFDTDYRDNENPEVSHGHVLKGAALTNRPVIKKMSPAIQLSETEFVKEQQSTIKETKAMSEKKLSELEEDNKVMGGKLEQVDAFMKSMNVGSIEELMKMISDLRTENETMLSEKKDVAKKIDLDALLKDGKINAAQHEGAMKLSEDGLKGFVEMMKVGENVVKMSESGTDKTPKSDIKDEDVQDKVIELSEKKMKDDENMTFSEATAEVLNENKELKEKYEETYN